MRVRFTVTGRAYRPVAFPPRLPRLHTSRPVLCLAAMLAGCGAGAGHQGPAKVTITRDFGSAIVREVEVEGGTVGSALKGAPGARYVNGVAAGDGTELHRGDRVWSDGHAAAAR